jgi:hypothetical protein
MNPDTDMSLDEAVAEVLGQLFGLELTYNPELERYRVVTRMLNRAIRANALEAEWSYYSSVVTVGNVQPGVSTVRLSSLRRPRIINDDAVRLVDKDGSPHRWAYFLPRDALHKYAHRRGLWCSVTKTTLYFSRPFRDSEAGLEIQLPVMREPTLFKLPPPGSEVPPRIRKQLMDFPYPDLIVARAAHYYAMADPVMQPRVQTLEAAYKDMMYQLIERDTANTDTPLMNEFILPLENGLYPSGERHLHPHA